MVAMATYPAVIPWSTVVGCGRHPGRQRPCRSDATGREAGVSPAQSRYGDRPPGAEVRSPPCRRRSSLREKGQAHRAVHRLTPASPKQGVFCFLPRQPGVPVDARTTAARRRGRTLSATLLFAIALAIAACAGPAATATPTPTQTPTPASSATPAPTQSPSPSPVAAFPITLTDDEGTQVEIKAAPEKIVSLTPAATE